MKQVSYFIKFTFIVKFLIFFQYNNAHSQYLHPSPKICTLVNLEKISNYLKYKKMFYLLLRCPPLHYYFVHNYLLQFVNKKIFITFICGHVL